MPCTLVPLAAAVVPFVFLCAASASTVEVAREIEHDVSQPLRTLQATSQPSFAPKALSLLRTPGHPTTNPPNAVDGALQESATGAVGTVPGLNLLGLGSGFVGPNGTFAVEYAPPDTNGAIGTTQYFEVVNLSFAVFDKVTGAPTLGPLPLKLLFAGFRGGCNSDSLTDPVVLFDKMASRWVVESFTASRPSMYCFAVSKTSDATGAYNRYAFASPEGLPDYTKIATWPDAYYLSTRLFQNGLFYAGPRACAVERAKMLTGETATIQCFQINNKDVDGMLPSDLDGTTPPPAGSPNIFAIQGTAGSNLFLLKFHVDFATPGNSTFNLAASIPVAPYTPASAGVPQKGTSTTLDSLGEFLMHRASYRNFGTYSSLLITHSVVAGRFPVFQRNGMRWYEIRSLETTPTLFQQGTYAPDLSYRWMGSIAQDKMGNIALGYSVSSSNMFPEIRYTGRVPSDPPGTLQAESPIFAGSSSQTSRETRWGDYTSMSVDPVDDCTMWYANEYLPDTGPSNWSTRIFSFKFPTCK